VWCTLMKNEVISPLIFEEPTVTTRFWLWWRTHRFASGPCENSFPVRWCSTSILSSYVFVSFWTGGFLTVTEEKGGPFPRSSVLQIWDHFFFFFFLLVCKRQCLSWKRAKC